jgi:hypothetical protein
MSLSEESVSSSEELQQRYNNLTQQSLALHKQIGLLRVQIIDQLNKKGLTRFVVTPEGGDTREEYCLVHTNKKKAPGKTHIQRLLAAFFATVHEDANESDRMAHVATRYVWEHREGTDVTQLRHITPIVARNAKRTRSRQEYASEQSKKKQLRDACVNPTTTNCTIERELNTLAP